MTDSDAKTRHPRAYKISRLQTSQRNLRPENFRGGRARGQRTKYCTLRPDILPKIFGINRRIVCDLLKLLTGSNGGAYMKMDVDFSLGRENQVLWFVLLVKCLSSDEQLKCRKDRTKQEWQSVYIPTGNAVHLLRPCIRYL